MTTSTHIARSVRLVLAGATVLAVSACAQKHSTSNFTVGSVPDDYRARHAITIAEAEQTLDIPIGSDARGLSVGTRSQIQGFAARYAAQPNGAMRVLLPSGSSNAGVASNVGADIVEALSRGGVAPNSVQIMHYDASRHGPAAPIRLSFHRVSAGVEGKCGEWKRDLTDHATNRNYHNFGCATQKNLAAIVANPSDLLAPRGTTTVDAQRRARAIEDYRAGQAPAPQPGIAGEFDG